MEFVGEHLKKSRLNKKIDLKTVVTDLNINSDLLKRIENNDFSEDYINKFYSDINSQVITDKHLN